MKDFSRRAAALGLSIVLALSLGACGGKDKESGKDTSPAAESKPAQASAEPTPTPVPTPEPTPNTPEVPLVAWGPNQVVEHLFFHPVIAYPQWAFHDCAATKSEKEGLDDWMVTADEYKKILQSLYDNDYVLVSMNDVWSEYTNDNGQTRMRRNTLMIPQGKKPLIISYDDVNYYQYMLEQGFTSKLVVATDGKIWAECTDPYTNKTFLTRDLDAVTILDKFVEEHPDFSPYGVKGCLCLTGYQGILGYRTQSDLGMEDDAAYQANRQKEIQAVKPVIRKLKETGWYFGSHTYGHLRLSTASTTKIKQDTERWLDQVGSLVGPTQLLFYPHGARPDGDHDQGDPGEQFKYLQSVGFRIFSSVGIESFSRCKSQISAVICDRLHPDGTTLRSGSCLKRYSQFYNAKEIIDLDVRPNLGVSW